MKLLNTFTHLKPTLNPRLEICYKCPLYHKEFCNNKLYLNPTTNQISIEPKPGYINGCGCRIKDIKKCRAGKW